MPDPATAAPEEAAPLAAPVASGAGRRRRMLALASFLMLFAELVLIRWSGANVVHLRSFTNFILLASFLGIGIGFLRAQARRSLFAYTPAALAAYVAFVLAFPVHVGRSAGAHALRGLADLPALPQWIELPLLFIGAAVIMALIAEKVGRLFATFEPLEAYRLDILGSIGGIAAFSVLSFFNAPPLTWALVIAACLYTLLERPAAPARAGPLAAFVVLLGVQSLLPHQTWSPYYKVTTRPSNTGIGTAVAVNNTPHQSIRPVAVLAGEPNIYFPPYERLVRGTPGDALIVGAGTGNDVAVALLRGADRVDAVEIDPVIQRIGAEEHPDRPYDDPRVHVHIDDGRAFLQRTDQEFDLILFALPDSLTAVSQSALRLESFLFTEEAIEEARDHLAPDGVFSMYNYYRADVFERFAATLHAVFGQEPCVDFGEEFGSRRQAVLTVSLEPGDVQCARTWRPASEPPELATDDHPFPYLPGRTIPAYYLFTLGLILVLSALAIRAFSGPLVRMAGYIDLFFMGAAFLLLETKNVVQFALLFGTTWFVNALVFGGILLSVLAAIEVARRARLPRPAILYALLAVALTVAWAVQPEALVSLPVLPRFAAATALAFTPIFLANVIFAQRFRDVGSSTVAFGANLLGAMLGGVLEYGALVTGYRALLVVVALLYTLAFVGGRRHLAAARAGA